MIDQFKPRTNVPLYGVVTRVSYFRGKDHTDDKGTRRLPDSLLLKGRWGEDRTQLRETGVFLDVSRLGVLLELGLLRQDEGVDNYGNPRYSVLDQVRVLVVLKAEVTGTNRKELAIRWADASPDTAAAAPAAAKPAPVAPRAPEPPRVAPLGPPASAPAKVSDRRRLADIAQTAGCALRAAQWEVDLFLAERKGTLANAENYFDLVGRLAAVIGAQAFNEDLNVRRSEKKTEGTSPARDRTGAVGAQGAVATGPRPPQPPPPIATDDAYTGEPVPELAKSERSPMGLEGFDGPLPDDDELPF